MRRPARALAILFVALIVSGCSSAGAEQSEKGAGGILGATTWVLQAYDNGAQQVEVPPSVYVDATFVDRRMLGFAGCNDYSAVFVAIGSSIRISMPSSTLRLCGEPDGSIEQSYLQAITRAHTFTATRSTLRLIDIAGIILATYAPAPANPLLGDWNVVSLGDGRGTVSAPVAGSTLTASFGAGGGFLGFGPTGEASGNSGCNSFNGSYEVDDSKVRIGPLATTLALCADEAMNAQEQAYLAALQDARRIGARGNYVELQSRQGSLLVGLQREGTPIEPGASPSAPPSASPPPSAPPSPSPSPSPSPTPVPPTASPSPPPPATPPPGTPTPVPTPDPSAIPSATALPTASCSNPTVGATITYPASWFTVAAPSEFACQLFDESPIAAPADDTAPSIAIVASGSPDVPWPNALAAATDTNRWQLQSIASTTVAGLPAVRIEAVSNGVEGQAYPAGTWRYLYLVDRAAEGTFAIETRGQPGDAYDVQKQVVDLMAATLVLAAPS